MSRVSSGPAKNARRKKILKAAKGYYGRRKNTIRTATAAVDRASKFAYRDRRARKRNFRRLWIVRINAAARQNGLTYGQMINGLNKAGIEIDRKALADLAATEPAGFTALAEQAKAALG